MVWNRNERGSLLICKVLGFFRSFCDRYLFYFMGSERLGDIVEFCSFLFEVFVIISFFYSEVMGWYYVGRSVGVF